MLFNLILRNVKRNLQVYLIYFLSLSIIYALLYAFNAVPHHPVMGSLSGAKANMTNIFGQYMGIHYYERYLFGGLFFQFRIKAKKKGIGFIFGFRYAYS